MNVESVRPEYYQKDAVVSVTNVSSSDSFKQLFDRVEIAEEIKAKYDVTLDVETFANVDALLNNNDIRCKNMVCISPEILEKMERDPALKKKVLSAIEEFCSSEEQAKVNALQPPVKSAGMIVYPNGDILYWLEGYHNNLDVDKSKQRVITGSSFDNVRDLYSQVDAEYAERNSEQAMTILVSSFIKEKLGL